MKKLLSLLIVVAMIATFSTGVFAANGGITYNPDSDNELHEGPDGYDTDVDVKGYIGKDTIVTPIDPPIDEDKAVQVKIPTVLMWAAFEESNYEIFSPEYQIENVSEYSLNYKVTVQNFVATGGTDNSLIDNNLTLTLDPVGTNGFGSRTLLDDGTFMAANNTAEKNGLLHTNVNKSNIWKFKIGGDFSINKAAIDSILTSHTEDYLRPTYALTLKFEVTDLWDEGGLKG